VLRCVVLDDTRKSPVWDLQLWMIAADVIVWRGRKPLPPPS